VIEELVDRERHARALEEFGVTFPHDAILAIWVQRIPRALCRALARLALNWAHLVEAAEGVPHALTTIALQASVLEALRRALRVTRGIARPCALNDFCPALLEHHADAVLGTHACEVEEVVNR
jgi:hypothetical protein